MHRWHGNRKHVVWLLVGNTRPNPQAFSTSWIKQKCIQHWFQSVYPVDSGPREYEAFHTLKKATGGQAYPAIDLLREAINR